MQLKATILSAIAIGIAPVSAHLRNVHDNNDMNKDGVTINDEETLRRHITSWIDELNDSTPTNNNDDRRLVTNDHCVAVKASAAKILGGALEGCGTAASDASPPADEQPNPTCLLLLCEAHFKAADIIIPECGDVDIPRDDIEACKLTPGYLPPSKPIANDDEATTSVNKSVDIDVLDNDEVTFGFDIQIEIITQATSGTCIAINGLEQRVSVVYAPNPGSLPGRDTCTYEVCYKEGTRYANLCDTATVTIDVVAQPTSSPTLSERPTLFPETTFGVAQVQGNLVTHQTQCRKKICILSTGYDINHFDLPGGDNNPDTTSEVDGVGTCSGSGDCDPFQDNDSDSVGTHVSGLIAAVKNGAGIRGVIDQGASLYIVRVFQNRSSSTSAIIDGLNKCRDNEGDIVFLSAGGSSPFGSSDFQSAYDAGMLLVAPAGNTNPSSSLPPSWPASEPSVISVASTNSDNTRSSFSRTNAQVELAALGRNVLSTVPGNNFRTKTGTQFATALVSGVAAVVWSYYPKCTNVEIRNVLQVTALKCTGQSEDRDRDEGCGYGIAQAKAAVDYIENTPSACVNRDRCGD